MTARRKKKKKKNRFFFFGFFTSSENQSGKAVAISPDSSRLRRNSDVSLMK